MSLNFHASAEFANMSFSQLGEDRVLQHFFDGKTNGFYVDVGCYHPFKYSNTASLHDLSGWRGINIDANPTAIEDFKTARPDDINVNCAIGLKTGIQSFALFGEGAVNSLDPAMIEGQIPRFGQPTIIEVNVKPLSVILDEHLPKGVNIDLLDIDAEGWDLDVLMSNDWVRFRPSVVCVEVHGFNLEHPGDSPTFNFMKSAGYSLTSHLVVTSVYMDVRKQ